MKQLNISIRNERPGDYTAILRLTYEAFLTLDYPGRQRVDEHFLFHLLQGSTDVIPELCFVAEYGGEIVGHILYTRSKFKRPEAGSPCGGSEADTVTFGPLSVLPKHHRQGVGAALVRHSMDKARKMGFGAVLIVGVPDYYPKLGFQRASAYHLTIADGSATDAFMVYELVPGYLDGGGVYHGWAPEFDMAENDDEGFDAFHKQFMAEHFAGEITLRRLYDSDILLLERWLHAEHIAPWYEHPEDWLKEIRGRYGEFSFLTHMMAELDGHPIGFCQYYDCYYARQYEDWGIDISAPGKIFSIDYLIGEPEYLQRGFGKEIIRLLLGILRNLGAQTVIVQPDEGNEASKRSLLANGFSWDGKYYWLELQGDVGKNA